VAKDVEGKASCSGHDAGIGSDAAFVFTAGDIADIVVSVFDAPMRPDHRLPVIGWQTRG